MREENPRFQAAPDRARDATTPDRFHDTGRPGARNHASGATTPARGGVRQPSGRTNATPRDRARTRTRGRTRRGRAKALPPARITLDGRDVLLTVKPIKNIYLRIKPPDGRIEISAPADVSMGRLVEFMHRRSAWIDRQQARIRDAAAATTATGGHGTGTTPAQPPANPAQPVWDDARKREAKAIIEAALPGLLAKWTPIVGKAPTNISLRLMRSRWGSCTPKTGRIRLNLALAFLPPRFLENTLVHEMTHLWTPKHGPEFQRRMDRYLPGWREVRAEKNRDHASTLQRAAS